MKVSTTIRPLNYDDIYNGLSDYLDLVSLSNCQRVNFNFKYLDKITNNADEWKEYVKKLSCYCKKSNISIPVCHAYYLNSFVFDDQQANEIQKSKIEKCIELCKILGASIIVVHAGICFDDMNKYDKQQTVVCNVVYFLTLFNMANKNKIKIAIENNVVYNNSSNGDAVEPSVDVLNEVCYIINNRLGCKSMGICFDVGHANLANRNILNDILNSKENLFALHLHNNNGYAGLDSVWKYDTHSALMEGTIDIGAVIKLLKEINFDKELVVEAVYKGKNDIIIDYINHDIKILTE